MPSLRFVHYGPAAERALRDAIIEAKHGDALAPVTVAVPSNYAGLSLRRRLGAGELSLAGLTGREGLLNVRLLVLARVAELLGAPALAAQGRRPLTNPVRAEAIRAALAAEPGVFRAVAEHPATERSLAVTLRELRVAPADALDEIAGNSDRAASVVRLFRHMRESTADYYDEEDLTDAAAGAVRAGSPALRDVGHVILYLPRRLSPGERGLVEALAGEGGLTALVGLTGDALADEPARRLVTQLERACGVPEEPPEIEPAAATLLVAVTDAEEEVRAALRIVMERLAAGTPLHRMAVLYPTTQPYALLAHEQFGSAGVPHNGPAVRTLAQTLSGRTLLGLLNLRQSEFRRDAVMDWLSAAPVLERAGGKPAPAHRWDTISRSAGIVGGPGQWRERLAQQRRTLVAKLDAAERTEEADDWRVRRLKADIEQVGGLDAFTKELISKLDSSGERSWAEFAAWGKELLDRYLGGEGHRRDWPEDEVEAHRSVESALESLSTLSDIRPRIDSATFRRALERELDAPAGRVGRFGDGVFIGRIRDAMGADFDLVIVLGMTEGVIPARARDDPLLPDSERAGGGGEMPLRTNRLAEDRHDYLAALATASERILVYPRADLRGQRGRLPSRWLLEAASQLEGRTLFSADLDPPPARPWLEAIPSFEGALAGDGISASEQEYDLRSLLYWHRARKPLPEHYLPVGKPSLRDGLSTAIARAGTRFSRWDGALEDYTLAPSGERAVSPTALQNWAACPRKYLLGNVLHVAETEKPEDALRISALERGNLMHQALETFIREAAPRSSPDQPWSGEERNALAEIGERLCDEAEAAGVTGKPLLWRLDRERILRNLAGFLDKDEEQRAAYGVVPEAVELAFGFDGDDALIVPLDGGPRDDGRQVAFRGRIDRVDRSPDGSRLLVLDYKSGSADFDLYKKLDVDPVKGGKLLQLPIYGLAAQDRYGGEAAKTIHAYYWFVTEQSNYEPRGYPLGERELATFREAVSVIVDGIGGGLFPARPGARRHDGGFENCNICPFDRICPRDRAAAWERKSAAPALRSYVNLAEQE